MIEMINIISLLTETTEYSYESLINGTYLMVILLNFN